MARRTTSLAAHSSTGCRTAASVPGRTLKCNALSSSRKRTPARRAPAALRTVRPPIAHTASTPGGGANPSTEEGITTKTANAATHAAASPAVKRASRAGASCASHERDRRGCARHERRPEDRCKTSARQCASGARLGHGDQPGPRPPSRTRTVVEPPTWSSRRATAVGEPTAVACCRLDPRELTGACREPRTSGASRPRSGQLAPPTDRGNAYCYGRRRTEPHASRRRTLVGDELGSRVAGSCCRIRMG